jgi:hypothetical protein
VEGCPQLATTMPVCFRVSRKAMKKYVPKKKNLDEFIKIIDKPLVNTFKKIFF